MIIVCSVVGGIEIRVTEDCGVVCGVDDGGGALDDVGVGGDGEDGETTTTLEMSTGVEEGPAGKDGEDRETASGGEMSARVGYEELLSCITCGVHCVGGLPRTWSNL